MFADKGSGVVVKQEPASGTKLKEGAVVVLHVSKGSKVGVRAGRRRAAGVGGAGALRDAGFEVNIVTVPSQESSGTVVAQNRRPVRARRPGRRSG